MKTIITAALILIGFNHFNAGSQVPSTLTVKSASQPGATISITYPKHDQKVRGDVKIYGKAKPGAVVKLKISSTYFKKAYQGERVSKGEGPIKRLNRSFTLTADRSGNWILKNINLTNAGWEENFTIKASAEGKAVSINVYDHTKGVRMD